MGESKRLLFASISEITQNTFAFTLSDDIFLNTGDI